MAAGPLLYFSPTGALTIVDQDGVVATLGITAFGVGWEPRDQRRALTGFPVPAEPGWVGFEGEITLWRTDGKTLLYAQRARATDTVVELEYDVTFSDLTRIEGFTLALDVPCQRFAGEAVAFRTGDDEEGIITLLEDEGGYLIGTAEGEQVDIGPYAQPLLSITVVEPDLLVPLPIRTKSPVLDLRPFDLDWYGVQVGSMMAAGQEVSPDTSLSLRLLVEFPAAGSPPALRPPETIIRPGVRLCRDARVEGALCERVADVVSAAKQAYEGLLPDLAKEEIRVCALPVTSWRENIATNRRDTIYLRVRDDEFGEAMRADAGPVGMLCQAVAELYNPGRFPGLDRLIAHQHLVPAVVGKLGMGVLPGRDATPLATDGPDMLKVITGDAYAPVHPDFAATKALAAIEDQLGFEGLCALPRQVPANVKPDFAGFRAAALAHDPALAPVFRAYDEATDLELDDGGTHLVASFEPHETIRTVSAHPLRTVAEDLVVTASPEFEVSQTNEWAAQGTQSLRLHAEDPRAGIYLAIADPDWQLRDWRRFSGFEMDLMLEAETPERLRVLLMDDVGGAHGQVPFLRRTVPPGERVHLSEGFRPEDTAQRQLESECYVGPFRSDDVALLYIDIPHPTGQPVTLYIDNLRLTARALEDVGTGPRVLDGRRADAAEGRAVVPAVGEAAEVLWRMFGGGPQRTWQGPRSEATGALLWEFDTGVDQWVTARRHAAGEAWVTSPSVGPDGTLYVGSDDGKVYALDSRTGDVKWAFPTGERVTSTPAVGLDGTVYVGSWDWNVYALDGATGANKWQFRTDGQVASSPALAEDGTVYVAGGGTLYALNGTTGEQVWATQQDSILFGSPALSVDGRLVYAGLCYHPNRGLYALNAETGDREWWFRTEYDETSTPAVGPDGTVYFGSADDLVYALDGTAGELKWWFTTGRDAGTPAIGPNGSVYCPCDDTLYVLDAATGEELAQFRQKGIGATVGSNGVIYAGGEKLIALDASLRLLWEFDDGDTVGRPTIGPDGTIYVGSEHGKVYAIR